MSSSRFCARIAAARVLGRGRLEGWRFTCNKRGMDGSAKANIMRRMGAHVWGVVFLMPKVELNRLDRIEGGYERIAVDVDHDGTKIDCVTYASTRRIDDVVPFDWYRDHILTGAVEHDLPADYVAFLRTLPYRSPSR